MAMNLGEASARITLDISDLAGKSAQAQGILSDMDGAVGKSTSGFGKFQKALMGFGAAMIPAVGVGLSMAIDLEQAMANVNATLGGLDTSVLSELEQGFMDIGAASQFSAIEVAAVGDEIARAGFATEDIVDMTRSVVELSQATGTDLMTSVSGITSVMQIWSPAIVEADIALTDAARAADIFTVAANASSADVQDIIAGMRNFGPTAASIGIGFDEASGAIAYFTNYGLKAANAGVSMTRAIQNLQDPTAEAAELMQELGISVFDMEGNFVGLPTLFDQLHAAMADMTPEARNMALTTLFGAEAIDVMTVAAMTGGDPLRMILGLMEETGVAAEQSALRMDTLKAQFGELVESVTNLLGRMMSGLIPALRLFVDVANMVVNVLSRIPQPILAAIGAVMGLAAAFATLRGAAAGLQILSRLTGIAVPGGALFGGLATGLLAVAAAAGVAYAAIRFNLFGIGDAVSKFTSIWNNLADSAANNAISRFLISLGQALQTFDIDALDTIGRGLNALGRGVNAFFDGFRGPGAKDMETTTKHFEGFAELAEDGVTWKVKSEGGEELGEIIDSWDNVDGTTTVRIRTKGGEEFETTIDMATAFVSEDYEVEVEVDAKDARKTLDRVQDGLDAMTKSLEKSMFPALARFPRAASRAIDSIKSFTEGFRMARDLGNDFVTSTLRGLGTALPFLRADLARFEMGWRDLQDSFAYFRDQGLNPVEAGLMALGQIFPELETAMIGLYGVVDGLGDAFAAALRGDWAGAFEGLEQAARSAWVVIGEIAGGIGGLVVDLVNWTINTGVPAVTGWIADNAGNVWSALSAAAGWVWDGIVAVGTITLQIAGWLVDSAQTAWEAIKSWVLGHAGSDLSGAGLGTGGRLASLTGNSIPIGAVAVVIGSWVVSAAESLVDKIDTFIFGEAGDREFTIPVINVTVSRVNVLPFGDKIQEGIDTAVRVWQTAQEVHADIEEIRVRAGRARIDDSGGGGGFLDYLKGEIQTEIDHASATWDFIVDFSIVAHAEVRDEDSTYNQVVDLIGDMAGGWGMLHGGTVDWDFVLGEPEILGFGLIDAALWIDEHIYQPIKDAVDGLKDKFTFDLPDITIKWPKPPGVPGWLKQLFTDPAGWIKDQVGIGGGDEGTSGAGEVIGNFMSDLEFGAARATGAMLQAAAAVREAGDASEEASTQTSLLETAAQTASRGVYNFGVRFAEAMGLGLQPLMAMRSQVESLGRFLSVSLPPVKVQVTAETDMAMQGMSAVQNALAGLDGASATTYQLGDNAGAMASVAEAAGAVAGIDGMTALTHVNGDNANALGAVMGAAAAVGGIDGMTATTYINGVNNVGAAVADAWNALNSIDGATATAYVNVVSSGSGLGGRVPGFADGGYVRSSLAIVGEEGPELVSLPYGSYVHTAAETARMLAQAMPAPTPYTPSTGAMGGNISNTTTVIQVDTHIAGNIIGNDDFADEMADRTAWKIASVKQRRDLAKGVAW